MKKIKIMYDFDGTLSPLNMQDFTLYKNCGFKTPEDFWEKINNFTKNNNIDSIISFMWFLQQQAKKNNFKLTEHWLNQQGKKIEYYNGVQTYFKNITNYAKTKGVEIEHYIISSGLKEILDGTKIAKYFNTIYASFYLYNEKGEACYPSQVINSTNKTQFLFRIEKNILDYNDPNLNNYLKPEDRFPFENMIYIGDGFTDIPCMKITKEKGGTSIVVYNPKDEKSKETAKNIYNNKRVNCYAPADYSKTSELYKYLKSIIDRVSLEK